MPFKLKNIVIADDDQDDTELLQSAVRESCLNFSLAVVTDGTKLMSLLYRTPAPDIIFLDINMLGMSGKECLIEIRSVSKFDDVLVIMLSTSSRVTEIDYCLDHGADHYFVKPNSYDGLKKIVRELCNDQLIITDKYS